LVCLILLCCAITGDDGKPEAPHTSALARGLAGLVLYEGRWQPVADVERAAAADRSRYPVIQEYLERRAAAPSLAEPRLKLAAWCADHGLKEQAFAHYVEVTRLDPARETAWKRLGYKKQGNRWVHPQEAAAQKLEADRQRHADQKWKPRLEKVREGLASSSASRKAKAKGDLADVSDPRAVPMVMKVFGGGSEPLQVVAVQLLSQIHSPLSSLSLASLAVDSPSGVVRGLAGEALHARDPREFVGRLIAQIKKPYTYEVKPALGPGSAPALIVDGKRFDIQTLVPAPIVDEGLTPQSYQPVEWTPALATNAVANNAMLEIAGRIALYQAQQRRMMLAAAVEQTRRRDQDMQRTLGDQVQLLDDLNASISKTNGRVLPLLQLLTAQGFAADPHAWQRWWSGELGVTSPPSPATKQPSADKSADSSVGALESRAASAQPKTHQSCLGGGTVVHSIDGPRAIESMQVGDLVLSQDTNTGELAFRVVIAAHRSQPMPTFRVTIDDKHQAVVATSIQTFWKVGEGWRMARDLKAGDHLRRVGGIVSVESIATDVAQPVYSLDVGVDRDLFVGKSGLLIHDSSLAEPAAAPFDRVPEATGSVPAGQPQSQKTAEKRAP
jgi:Pretoxin HINT domain